MRVVLGVSGASGAALAAACARHLSALGAEIDLVISKAGERTLVEEIGLEAADALRAQATRVHAIMNVGAAIASGSAPWRG